MDIGARGFTILIVMGLAWMLYWIIINWPKKKGRLRLVSPLKEDHDPDQGSTVLDSAWQSRGKIAVMEEGAYQAGYGDEKRGQPKKDIQLLLAERARNPLEREKLEAWFKLYNQGYNDSASQHPHRFEFQAKRRQCYQRSIIGSIRGGLGNLRYLGAGNFYRRLLSKKDKDPN